MIDTCVISQGFHLEFGKAGVTLDQLSYELEEATKETFISFYRDNVANVDHEHFLGEDKSLGPVVISLECREKGAPQKILRGIVRTKKVLVCLSHRREIFEWLC